MMKSAFLYLPLATILLLTVTPSRAQQCEFRLVMHDIIGDGWNGGVLTLSSGSTVHTFFLADDASDSTTYFPVSSGATVVLNWSPGPLYNEEVAFELYNNDGDLLFGAADPASGIVFETVAAACVACLKPTNVLIENVYDTRVKVRWSPATGISIPVGWWVIYGPKGFTPAPGAGDSLYVATPKATITGLTPKTTYDFYVQQDCGNGETGSLAGPFGFETYRSNDVGITGVLTPKSGCDLGVETVAIRMTNFGANPQSLIPFNFSVNGTPAGVPQPQDGFYTGVLGKDSSEAIKFETTFNFSNPGEYVIAAWTEMTADEFTANDTFYYRINNRLPAPYQQDFETWAGGWYADTLASNASTWQFGMPAGTDIATAASGKNAWVTNLSGAYHPNELSYLNSPCFDFSALQDDPVIEFSLIYSSESGYDGGFLEMSFDNGDTWEKAGALNEGLNWYNAANTPLNLGDLWTGKTNGWIRARHQLSGAGGQSLVHLRFGFGANNNLQLEGMGVDDIQIYEPLADDLAGLSAATDADGQDCGLENDKVHFRFTNFGSNPQTGFNVYYSIDGAAPVVENVGPALVQPDEIFDYTFTTPFDSRDGVFNIRCWTGLSNENAPANDTAMHMVNHLPGPVPLHEDFEAGLPANWQTNGFVTNGHNNTSQVLAYRMNASAPIFSAELPRVGFVSPGDSLTFDYRIVNFSGDGTVPAPLGNGTEFIVLISSDCGLSFQPAYTINAGTHTPSVDMQRVAIDLTPYAGFSVLTRFAGAWGFGDFYFDLDNVNLRACAPDMQLTAETTPADPGQSNGSATVFVGLGNPPYHYAWINGDSTQTADSLATGLTSVTVTDDLGCSGTLDVYIGNSPVSEAAGLTRLGLYPNPTTGATTLLAAFAAPSEVRVELLDLTGRLVWRSGGLFTDQLTLPLELNGHPDGMYLVRLSANGHSVLRKLVKI